MRNSIYAISDVHGYLDALNAALEIVNIEDDPDASLVLLGDYVDRGPNSAEVLYTIRNLQMRHRDRVTVLQGNHEAWLLDWVFSENDDPTWVLADPGFVTLRSFLEPSTIVALAKKATAAELNGHLRYAMRYEHLDLLRWLQQRPLVHETDSQIFVHAGIDELAGAFWRAATPDYWFTDKYPASRGPFLKTVIAGHVRTSELHEDGSHSVYYDGKSHYYIDGAVEVTGQLNVLHYDCATGEYSSQMTPPTRETASRKQRLEDIASRMWPSNLE